MSQESDATTIRAAINTQFPTKPRALPLAEAKVATTAHIIVFVSRRFVPEKRAGGSVMLPGWRVRTRYISKVEADISVFREATRTALEGVILAGDIGPFSFEAAAEDLDDDDGWFVAADDWTY